MPAPREGIPLDRLREAIESGVAESSLRGVAREVGMSPSGLQKFLDGSRPYSATRRKLERWYVREAVQYGGDVGAGSILAALHILTQNLPRSCRSRISIEVVDLLESAYLEGRRRPPDWLGEVRRRLAGGDE